VSENTIRRWEKAGLLKAIRVGNGTRLFSRAAIEKFEAARAAAIKEKNERVKKDDNTRTLR
jgi:DNA-binding transcriptional MerR regulator